MEIKPPGSASTAGGECSQIRGRKSQAAPLRLSGRTEANHYVTFKRPPRITVGGDRGDVVSMRGHFTGRIHSAACRWLRYQRLLFLRDRGDSFKQAGGES